MSFEPPEAFNIADYFLTARLEEGRGERTALRMADQELTYAEVDGLANRFGNGLRDFGVRQEERVLIALPDGAEFVAALFGTLKIGAVVVMVNPGLPVEQLAAIIHFSRARAAVIGADAHEQFETAGGEAGRAPALLVTGSTSGTDATFDPNSYPDALDPAATHRDDPAIWLFSGGTTGAPKAVVQTHRSFANTTELYAKQAVGYREEDITISVPKLYFGYATGSNLFFPFAVGASSVLFPEHPTPEVLFTQIARNHPTVLVNVPSMIAKMLDHPGAAEADLSSLRFATSAGEALPIALHERWRQTFGVELLDGLGTAEMWHVFVSNTPGNVRPGTLGRPVPGFDVAVRDDDGHDVEAGEVGRLWVRGGSRALAYWQDMERSTEAFRGEWFVGGDLVSQDDDGYITYVGRGDDALKVKGKWLVPSEVENVLVSHDRVREAVVVGVTDEDGLVKPVAFVVVEGETEGMEEELKAHVLDRLEAYKHPRQVIVVDDLPRTHLGKVNRGALKDRAGS
jgi:benzoate-CoA ligase family protein